MCSLNFLKTLKKNYAILINYGILEDLKMCAVYKNAPEQKGGSKIFPLSESTKRMNGL